MTIHCPKCGFAGGWGATIPLGDGPSEVVDLLDAPKHIETEVGEFAICSQCASVLVFAGWMEMPEDLMSTLSPENRKMLRQAQEAARRFGERGH